MWEVGTFGAAAVCFSTLNECFLINMSLTSWLRRQWQPTPVLLPGKSHGQRSLVGYGQWGRKESDTTEWLNWTELSSLQEYLANPDLAERFQDWCSKVQDSLGFHVTVGYHASDLVSGSLVLILFKSACVCAKLLQLCLTLCNPMDCSLPGSSVHGFLQVRILEWSAMPSSSGSFQPRDRPSISLASYVFCIGKQVLYH